MYALRSKAVSSLVAIIMILAIVAIGIASAYYVPNQSSNTAQNNTGTTTLEDILAGKFKSALDKQGADGTIVSVDNLKVLYTEHESDGDWHVAVTDGSVPVFITEVTSSNI